LWRGFILLNYILNDYTEIKKGRKEQGLSINNNLKRSSSLTHSSLSPHYFQQVVSQPVRDLYFNSLQHLVRVLSRRSELEPHWRRKHLLLLVQAVATSEFWSHFRVSAWLEGSGGEREVRVKVESEVGVEQVPVHLVVELLFNVLVELRFCLRIVLIKCCQECKLKHSLDVLLL